MSREPTSVPTGPCQFPGCEGSTRDGHQYCFDCRRKMTGPKPSEEGRS